jgi:hypothetical protein
MLYALVWMMLLNGEVDYYHIETFGAMEECQKERKEAEVMVTHSSQVLACLELSP